MFKFFLSNKLVRQVSLLLSGTVLVQLINFGFMPVVLRIYGPESFGVLGAFNAALLLLFPLAALCLPMAIVLGKNNRDVSDIAALARVVACVCSGMLLIVLLLFKQPVQELLSLQAIGNYIFLLPVALLFATRLQIIQQILIKKEFFRFLAKADVLQALLVNLIKLLLGLWHAAAIVLIAIAVFASILHSTLLRCIATSSHVEFPAIKWCSLRYWRRLKRTWKKYQAFPLYQAPQALLNAAAQSVPVLMLAGFYGPAAAGFYTLAKAVLVVPSVLLGRAVGDVFYPHFTKAHQLKQPLLPVLLKATFSLALIGIVPFSLFFLLGPWLFEFIFGMEWQQSGEYARWMALWLYTAFANTPSVKAVMVLQVQHWAIAINVITLSLRIGVLWLFTVLFYDPVLAVAAYAMVGVLHSVVFILTAMYFSKKNAVNSLV